MQALVMPHNAQSIVINQEVASLKATVREHEAEEDMDREMERRKDEQLTKITAERIRA